MKPQEWERSKGRLKNWKLKTYIFGFKCKRSTRAGTDYRLRSKTASTRIPSLRAISMVSNSSQFSFAPSNVRFLVSVSHSLIPFFLPSFLALFLICFHSSLRADLLKEKQRLLIDLQRAQEFSSECRRAQEMAEEVLKRKIETLEVEKELLRKEIEREANEKLQDGETLYHLRWFGNKSVVAESLHSRASS